MDHLNAARGCWDLAQEEGNRHDAQLAIGAALIGILEEFKKMNERAELEAEREEVIENSRLIAKDEAFI